MKYLVKRMIYDEEVLVRKITVLILFFREVNDVEHIKRFEYICNLARSAKSESEFKQSARTIKQIFRGLGSFNDLNYWQP